jgi:hypothetical protein
MKMNKADMAKMDMENETSEGDVGKATPAHENAESGTKEHKEDMAQDSSEGEDMGEEDMGGEDMGMEHDYKAQCDANDLLRAAEIKSDPSRMKAALESLGQKKKAIDSMEELMAVRKDKMMMKK